VRSASVRQIALFAGSPVGGPPAAGPIGAIEAWLQATGHVPSIGVDEAGRGPLAGPVVAAAVCLPASLPPTLGELDDSKKLSESTRERLFDVIRQHAVAWGVGISSAARIDAINILEATREAMRDAIEQAQARLGRSPAALLVDGNLALPGWTGLQWPLVKGDSRSLQIAAASVLAKVTRDRLMVELDARHPGYGFARHKGYGTLAHRRALMRLGPCAEHRQSFQWREVDCG
jgi:ribonuclease HII